MFRFFVAVSLIICVVVAGVAPQEDATIKAATDTEASSQLATSDDSIDKQSDEQQQHDELLLSGLANLFSIFSAPFFPSMSDFFSPMEFLARPNYPQNFDVANCRLSVDLAKVADKSTVAVDLVGQTVLIQITSSTSESNNTPNSMYQAAGTIQDVSSRTIPDSCLVDPKRTDVEFNKSSKLLSLTFPRASTSTDESAAAATTDAAEAEADNEEPKTSEDGDKPREGENGDRSNNIGVNFMSRPVSIIE